MRIEDIDAARCRPEYAAAIVEDLAWLGVDWDGPVRVQSANWDDYRAVLNQLAGEGLLYPCFCTRADIAASAGAPHGPDGSVVYPGTCRGLAAGVREARMAAGERYAWRLDMGRAVRRVGRLRYVEAGARVECRPERFGDVVLGRKDAPASYHLCVTHDDAAQGVTLVTRGEDLRAATDVHRVLQAVMGWAVPDYAHHALVVGADGARLSKRGGAAALREMRAGGVTAEAVRTLTCARIA